MLLFASLRPSISRLTTLSPFTHQIRGIKGQYGCEYQPNNQKRKRTHGFLARLRSVSGRKILGRRFVKGRRALSH